jgi:hypothetical protein
MTVRLPLISVLFLTLAAAAPAPADAHAGGHHLAAGTTLHVWAAPGTGAPVPGSLLFVSAGHAHVEDIAGRVHVWAVADLHPADRAVVAAFRARTARLNTAVARSVRQQTSLPEPTPPLWLGLAGGLAILLAAGAAVPGRRRAQLAIMTVALALPLACGSSNDSSSVTISGPTTPTSPTSPTAPTVTPPSTAPDLASYFTAFPGHVRTRQDSQNLYVESDGMADHVMMVRIRSWQQQVPLPQPYTGSNAWTIPLNPRLSDAPVSARTNLFRGAIALAVNGVPIFNALNNRGDDAFLAGELDDFGGHGGRADDYHYHTAPLFLESTVGATRPIGVALDGFLLYGSAEPDGSAVRALDDYNGHADAVTTYHYHGTRTYPYINGGMKGVVTVKDGQVDPQPAAAPVRPAGTPLNGATITRFASTGTNAWRLEYQLGGRTYTVDYRIDGNRYTFVFTDPSGATKTETYTR